MVSALVQVGLGKMQPDDIRSLLELRDRTKAPPTAPAEGLFLVQVEYPLESDPIFSPVTFPVDTVIQDEAEKKEKLAAD